MDEIWKTKKIKETKWDRDYKKCFDEELDQIKKKTQLMLKMNMLENK